MRCRNRIIYSRGIGRWNQFPGTVDGHTYTGTEDNQLLRLWGNNVSTKPSSGMYTAVFSDMTGGIKPADKTRLSGNVASCDASVDWWPQGVTLDKGAKLTIQCVGYYAAEDWQIMQALGIDCWDKDSAPY